MLKYSYVLNKLIEIIDLYENNNCIGYYGDKRIYIRDSGTHFEVYYK